MRITPVDFQERNPRASPFRQTRDSACDEATLRATVAAPDATSMQRYHAGGTQVFMGNARHAFVVVAALAVITPAFEAGVNLHAQTPSSAPERLTVRIDRLEAWVAAVAQHVPGTRDSAVLAIARWNAEQLRGVWIDVSTLITLARDPSTSVFYEPDDPAFRLPPAGSKTVLPRRLLPIAYSRGDLNRLRSLAATLGSRTDGRENLLLKRGAMLHADVAMLAPSDARLTTTSSSPGSRRYRLGMNDGRPTGIETQANHWDVGRRLLDDVRYRAARGTAARGPGMDQTVRLWYLGTCAFQIRIGDLDPPHFVRAIELFPDDPDLLFLRGALHEVMASARRQSAARQADVPLDLTLATGLRREELSQAERFYRRAVERLPAFHEARIRYARVLGERGRHAEAVRELERAAGAQGPLLQYYAALFLAGELEAVGRDAEAIRAYERAADLSPTAQSPRLGLSRLAIGRDRGAASEALLRLAAQESQGDTRDDPWWAYDVAGGRGADIILNALHASIDRDGQR